MSELKDLKYIVHIKVVFKQNLLIIFDCQLLSKGNEYSQFHNDKTIKYMNKKDTDHKRSRT